MEQHPIVKPLKSIAKYLIITIMVILVLGMILATADLILEFVRRVLSPDPVVGLINVTDLYVLFSVLLVIMVGYELFKSMLLILHHDSIPVRSILKIATIAMANKIITMNIKEVEFNHMIGIGAIIVATGLAFFFFNQEKIQE